MIKTEGTFWELVSKYADPYDERWLEEGVIAVDDLIMIFNKVLKDFPGKAIGDTPNEARFNLISNIAKYLKDTFGYEYKGDI